jgi:hypothetical protein
LPERKIGLQLKLSLNLGFDSIQLRVKEELS